MKISPYKFPFFFDFIFLVVTLFQSALILILNPPFSNFLPIYMDAIGKVWWLALVAILLHVIAYLLSLEQNIALFTNLLAILGYLTLIIIPNYLLLAIIFLFAGLVLALKSYIARN